MPVLKKLDESTQIHGIFQILDLNQKYFICQNQEWIDQLLALLQENIDGVRALKASDFDYEGKAPEDWRGWTPK